MCRVAQKDTSTDVYITITASTLPLFWQGLWLSVFKKCLIHKINFSV